MVRGEWMNLNGMWDYGITEAGATGFKAEGEILVHNNGLAQENKEGRAPEASRQLGSRVCPDVFVGLIAHGKKQDDIQKRLPCRKAVGIVEAVPDKVGDV